MLCTAPAQRHRKDTTIVTSDYSDKVIDHFTNPRNVGVIENPDGLGKVGNPICGDVMELAIRVEDGTIKDAKFRTFGCAAAIATSSILTELVKDKTIDEALRISNGAVVDALDGLPSQKRHCSVLAEEALQASIADMYKRRGEEVPESIGKRLQHLAAKGEH